MSDTAEAPTDAAPTRRYENVIEQLIAELVGTMLFVFIGAGSVVVFSHAAGIGGPGATTDIKNLFVLVFGLLAIALAHGLAMAVLVSNTGHISGGHHNPVVTAAIWVAGKIEALRAVLYILAQLAGAAAGAWLLSITIPKGYWAPSALGTPSVNHAIVPNTVFTNGRAVLFEAILTFVLVYTVFATAVDERGSFGKVAGFPIGLAIGVDILVGGPFTGAAMNPARWFGPALVSSSWTDWWVYIVGPLTGAILAAAVYWLAFLRTRPEPTVDYEQEPGEYLIHEPAAEDEPPYEPAARDQHHNHDHHDHHDHDHDEGSDAG